jgi:hypothetical protein
VHDYVQIVSEAWAYAHPYSVNTGGSEQAQLQLNNNKIGNVYSLEYTEVPKMFTPITGGDVSRLFRTAQRSADLYNSYSKGITNPTIILKATMISNVTVAIM